LAKRVLIIGAEAFSKFIDWTDRKTCVLFGDGAGAVIIEKAKENDVSGVLGIKIKSDGRMADFLKSSGGISSTKTAGYICMNGVEVFRHAVLKMAEILEDLLLELKIT